MGPTIFKGKLGSIRRGQVTNSTAQKDAQLLAQTLFVFQVKKTIQEPGEKCVPDDPDGGLRSTTSPRSVGFKRQLGCLGS